MVSRWPVGERVIVGGRSLLPRRPVRAEQGVSFRRGPRSLSAIAVAPNSHARDWARPWFTTLLVAGGLALISPATTLAITSIPPAPVARHIVFKGVVGDFTYGLFEANPDGSDPELVPGGCYSASPNPVGIPALSPDGRDIAYRVEPFNDASDLPNRRSRLAPTAKERRGTATLARADAIARSRWSKERLSRRVRIHADADTCSSNLGIYIDDLRDPTGGDTRPLYINPTDGSYTVQSDPVFAPDGSKVFFIVVDGSGNADIASVNIDGSDFTIVVPDISWAGGPPAISPDGTKIAYIAPVANGATAVMVVDSDGSNPVQITDPVNTMITGPETPTFSPDGTKIAIINDDALGNDLWVMNASDGSDLTQLTSDGDVTDPQWSTDGSELLIDRYDYDDNYDAAIFGVNPTTGATQMVGGPPSGFTEAYDEAASPPGSPNYVSDTQYLALTFEPLVLLDTTEPWPPLSVDAFFAEGDNHICTAGQSVSDCAPITGESSLAGYNALDDFIAGDGNGNDAFSYQDENINSDCESSAVLDLLDCNSGPRSLIYYHVAPYSETGYYYIDYWLFYRFNYYEWGQYYTDVGDHEGDWESVTIGLSTTDAADTFDFASFSQHGHWYSYLRQNLTCDSTVSSPGSCVGSPNVGNRVSDFVASGTHANYPDECSGGSTLPDACYEENDVWAEGSHNGELVWGNNFFDDASLSLLPTPGGWSTGSGTWTDWPGLWGNPNVFTTLGETPPRGPDGGDGSNATHYNAPWGATCSSGNDNCPLGAADAATAARGNVRLTAQAASALPEGEGLRSASNPAACGNWFGTGVSVLVCDPARLRIAVERAQLHRHGSFSASTTAQGAHRATAPGLVQILSSPLNIGDSATVVGPTSNSTVLFVRGTDGRVAWVARFAGVRLRRGAHAVLQVLRVRGKLVVQLVINHHVRSPNQLLITQRRLHGRAAARR